ncbi:MAG TPA: type IX secretion system outer membrane channel protein PorV, partial [Saprospiraceae bacterium]|nr:type IX secretion system outer membrane channel protein PorV [Saprospiraceae bacterium]
MPFLRIAPDARGGAMGDAGIALDPTPASIHYNASSLAFAEKDAALSATYTPWLQDLNLPDIYLAQLSGYKKIDALSTVGFQFKYFSLGVINFRDPFGVDNGDGRPREFQFGLAYARKLGDNLSVSVSGNYLFSALAPNQIVNGIEITNATSFATDIGLTYKKKMELGGKDAQLSIGAAITNLGSKVTYTRDSIRDFIPTNLGLGTSLKLELDEYNTITFALDFNKLMVPTSVSRNILLDDGTTMLNPEFSVDGDNVGDYRQKTLFEGVFGSFSDAQGGFQEELQEINYSLGAEYWYDQQFAARAGFFYEHPLKGARKYFTVGLGIKYNIFNIDLSYLIPGNNRRSPLDNTLR